MHDGFREARVKILMFIARQTLYGVFFVCFF